MCGDAKILRQYVRMARAEKPPTRCDKGRGALACRFCAARSARQSRGPLALPGEPSGEPGELAAASSRKAANSAAAACGGILSGQ